MVLTVCPVVASIWTTPLELGTATQTDASPTATSAGLAPSGIVCTTLSVPGSTRESVPLRLFVTQTAPLPTAIPGGPPPPRGGSRPACRVGSIRTTVCASDEIAHSEPKPAATPDGGACKSTTPRTPPSGPTSAKASRLIVPVARLDPSRASGIATAAETTARNVTIAPATSHFRREPAATPAWRAGSAGGGGPAP